MFYVEWCTSPQARKGRMVSLKALSVLLKLKDPGYASVYLFKEGDAKEIIEAGNSKGFDKYEVSSQFLPIDIDSGEESLKRVADVLGAMGLSFEVYESGGKGFHIFIPHEFITSKHLPWFHRQTIFALIPDCEKHIDLSLYQHGRLLSLPGRVHPKTGKKKKLVFSREGSQLTIDKTAPKISFDSFKLSTNDSILQKGLDRALSMAIVPPAPGNRHTAIWGASKDLLEAGLSESTVLDIMLRVNETWKDQKTETEVQMAVEQGVKTLKSA